MYKVKENFSGFIKRLKVYLESKKIRAVLIDVSAVCIALIGVRLVFAIIHNNAMQSEFKEVSDSITPDKGFYLPYSEGKSLYQFEEDSTKYGYQTFHPSWLKRGGKCTVKLTKDVSLYNGPSIFEKPIVTIKKGTQINIDTSLMSVNEFPGSLPTYEQGWRFTKIFKALFDDDDAVKSMFGVDDRELERVQRAWTGAAFHAYVKLEDLQSVWKDLASQYPDFAEPMHEENTNKTPLLYSDELLKENGVYLSPDLLKPVWDAFNTLLVITAAVCILAVISCKGGAENE